MPTTRELPNLLEVRDLRTRFFTDAGPVRAVDGVSFSIQRGRTTALVGESGCGKSVTALSIMRLVPDPPGRITGGSILFHDRPGAAPTDLVAASERKVRRIRGRRIAMVFQEPMSSLNPVLTIGEQIAESLVLHRKLKSRQASDLAADLLHRVGIADPHRRSRDYPHRLSGGMRQRVMIAMALAGEPSVLIADEPTTALDVTVQAGILELLRRLQSETGMGILMITHDFGVVAEVADDVCVMHAGRIVERAPASELLANPLHPYTQGLLECIPRLSGRRERLPVVPHPFVGPELREARPNHYVATSESQRDQPAIQASGANAGARS